jgi:diaminohydroxyphosphoribosylaminopyrimidine deaminase/5-amino-6-(5-phosphoribosylamino)uracil reductase
MVDARDYQHMARALRLAARGLFTTDPNPRVGCVLVKDSVVVGEGWHVRAGNGHAEINALEKAGEQARGATAYVTLEPCCHHGRTPPCTDAMLAAGVSRVVVAMEDPNPQVAGKGLKQLRAAGVTVECGIMELEACRLNPGFIRRMREERPFVRCKLAMSLDGRTAMASGESQWITGSAARLDVQRLRARSSAIMTGVATILADDPAFNVRLPGEGVRQPLRVILDTELRTPASARTLSLAGQVLIFTAVLNHRRSALLRARGAEVQILPQRGGRLDLMMVLTELARREINEVQLECGATLAGSMLRAGLVDELIVYMAPLLMGDQARGLFHLPGLKQMVESIRLEFIDIRAVGRDWRIAARPVMKVNANG